MVSEFACVVLHVGRIGPMDITLKQRKAAVNRKRKKPTEVTCPEEVSCHILCFMSY